MPDTTRFQERVYAKLKKVPKGKITTYGDLARAMKSSARAIGQTMRCNPYAPKIPCHRVVKSDGTIGGFGGAVRGKKIKDKIALLNKEGVHVKRGVVLNFEKVRYRW